MLPDKGRGIRVMEFRMLLLDSVEPEKWYKVSEVAEILGWSHDMIEDWINDELLQAFVIDHRSDKRKRIYRGKRVQGCEIRRFVQAHLSPLKEKGVLRLRSA